MTSFIDLTFAPYEKILKSGVLKLRVFFYIHIYIPPAKETRAYKTKNSKSRKFEIPFVTRFSLGARLIPAVRDFISDCVILKIAHDFDALDFYLAIT